MEHLDGILKLVDDEFASLTRNGKFRSREEIDSAYKLVDIVKDTYEIWCMEEELGGGEEGMSFRGGGSYRGGSYDGRSYDGRESRRSRERSMDGRRYAQASRTGRSNEGSYRGGRGRSMNYSRDDSRKEYIDELRDMMEDAPDDQTRQTIQRMIQQLEG